MSIAEDIQKLEPGALVELFVLDASALPGGGINYFHAGTNGLGGPVVWQGAEYQPWPVQARGFDKSGTGRLPRPTLTLANVLGTVGALARDFNDLLGARVIRKRTFVRYLDAVNFPGGTNPSASPVDAFPDDEFVVDQKTTENKHLIEFTLAARCDLDGVRIPLRVITQMCGWEYRGEGCGYAGPPVAKVDDTPTATPAEDRCGKRLASCKLRFGATAVLPYGGFPGVGLLM
ncbi:phage minor tail protein L [Pyxidicoccus caerfyrddinensis]|uniref:phage minor tail protein L n=1 Tax=Pyxidicoccus caerfyrddinensis TaxID=2709663 RepID=UPI0013DB2EAF|nr:phage minor tail protein L [Pyxidicoccus caerfyrddinensis]